MTTHFKEVNERLAELVDAWSPRLGPPTCHKGCSNCCRVVAASSAEALELAGFIQQLPEEEARRICLGIENHVRAIVERLSSIGQTTSPLLEVWRLGECPLLIDRACSVYPARPYACRAAHVWHDSEFCGASQGQSRVPAELMEVRDLAFWRTMREEVDAGRRPFWGQLSVVLYFIFQHADRYLAGQDPRAFIDPPWLASRLVRVPGQEGLDDAGRTIDRMLVQLAEIYSQESPHGFPRAERATRRADLDCDENEKRLIREERAADGP